MCKKKNKKKKKKESITGSDGMRIELYGNASINTEQGFLKVNGNYDFGKHTLFFFFFFIFWVTHTHTHTHKYKLIINQSINHFLIKKLSKNKW